MRRGEGITAPDSHRVADGDTLVVKVRIPDRGKGEPLIGPVVLGGEGQGGRTDGDDASRTDDRDDDHIAARMGRQHHVVVALTVLPGHQTAGRETYPRHGHRKGQTGWIAIPVRGCVRQRDLDANGGGCPGEGAGGTSIGVGQAGGKGAGQGVAQGAVAAGRLRQGQGRDGGVRGVGLIGNHRRPERRPQIVVVEDHDGQVGGGGDVAVAGDGVTDGHRDIFGVRIVEDGDGDGLGRVPGGGGEGQGGGDGHGGRRSGNRRHGDIAGRHGRQHHGIGAHVVLSNGEGRRGEGHAGSGLHGHDEVQHGRVGRLHVAIRIGDGIGQRDGRGGGCRRAGQGETVGIEGQPVGDVAGQGMDQVTVAATGHRQGQRRDAPARQVGLVGHRLHAEIRRLLRVVNPDGNGDRRGKGVAIADPERKADGGRPGHVVIVRQGSDGDTVIGRREVVLTGVGQCSGEKGDRTSGTDAHEHRHRQDRPRRQGRGVADRAPFVHNQGGGRFIAHGVEGGGLEEEPGHGHRYGKGQTAFLIRFIHGDVRQGDRVADGAGCAGQRAVGGGVAQPVGEDAGQDIAQRAIATGGFRQGQRRDGAVHNVGLRRDHRRAEGRRVVEDRDRQPATIGDVAEAGQPVGNGDGDVGSNGGGNDGDRLRIVPGRGAEGQGAGDGGRIGGEGRRHGDVIRGDTGHDHGVGGRVAFAHGEGRRIKGERKHHAGVGDRDGHVSRGGVTEAGDHVGDGDGVRGGVGIPKGRDGDALRRAPVGRVEDQRIGDGEGDEVARDRHHGDVTRGGTDQDHGIGGHAAFVHGQDTRLNGDQARHRHGKGQRSRVAVLIRDRPGQRDVRNDGGSTGQGAGVGVNRQPGREAAAQDIGPVALPTGGGREGEGGNRITLQVGLVGYGWLDEGRDTVNIGDRDGHGAGGDVAVAGDRMGNGDGVIQGVVVHAGADGDGLNGAPVGHAEGQRARDGEVGAGGADRRHGDIAGGSRGQPHGVGVHGTFVQGNVNRGKGHARPDRHGHDKGQRDGIAIPIPCGVGERVTHAGVIVRRRGDAGQYARGRIKRQTVGKVTHGVGQRGIAVSGRRQLLHHADTGGVDLIGHRRLAKGRHVVRLHFHGKGQLVLVGTARDPVAIRDRVGHGERATVQVKIRLAGQRSRGRAEQGACGGIKGQTTWKGRTKVRGDITASVIAEGEGDLTATQRIVQRSGAAHGDRQRQHRNGTALHVDLGGHHRIRGKGGYAVVVDDRDRGIGSGDTPVAADGVVDDDRLVSGVAVVLSSADGDGPGRAPVGGAEGQGTGDGHPADPAADRGGHDDIAVGFCGQEDGIGDGLAFKHIQDRPDDGDAIHGHIDGDGKGQGGRVVGARVVVHVRDGVGHRDRTGHGGGDAGQGAGAGVKVQADGEGAGQVIVQDAVAAGGCRQRQRRNDRLGGVPLGRHHGLAEVRCIGRGKNGDEHVGGQDAAVASHDMAEGDDVIGVIPVGGGRDGDGLPRVPGAVGEGQHRCSRQPARGCDDGRQRHDAVGPGIQTHVVGGRGALVHGERRWPDEDRR